MILYKAFFPTQLTSSGLNILGREKIMSLLEMILASALAGSVYYGFYRQKSSSTNSTDSWQDKSDQLFRIKSIEALLADRQVQLACLERQNQEFKKKLDTYNELTNEVAAANGRTSQLTIILCQRDQEISDLTAQLALFNFHQVSSSQISAPVNSHSELRERAKAKGFNVPCNTKKIAEKENNTATAQLCHENTDIPQSRYYLMSFNKNIIPKHRCFSCDGAGVHRKGGCSICKGTGVRPEIIAAERIRRNNKNNATLEEDMDMASIRRSASRDTEVSAIRHGDYDEGTYVITQNDHYIDDHYPFTGENSAFQEGYHIGWEMCEMNHDGND
ncbi:hypothetical protein ACLKQF_03635 [Aeromonas salmonicida]